MSGRGGAEGKRPIITQHSTVQRSSADRFELASFSAAGGGNNC